jgi:peptide/nickel transport system permease protein
VHWGIARFMLRRTALSLVTLFLVSIIIFGATQVLPGDAARAILGHEATPAGLAELRQKLHLYGSPIQQYARWIDGVAHLNLGESLVEQRPVTAVISSRIGNSAVLFLFAALSIPFWVAIGCVLALRRDGPVDIGASVAVLGLAALPEFVLAIMLVLLFGTTVFHVFPAVSLIDPTHSIWGQLHKTVLLAITLMLAIAPHIIRIMRAAMIDVLDSDYVEMARLKGVPERAVIVRHAVPNAIAPAIQIIALSLAWVAGGVVVVEYVFGYAGIGSGLVDAVSGRDVPVVQALTLLIAGLYIVLNLAADIATILVSPRVRTSLR